VVRIFSYLGDPVFEPGYEGLRHQGDYLHDDGGSSYLWNVGNFYQTTRRNNPDDISLCVSACCHSENIELGDRTGMFGALRVEADS
jgi:hypothetical protein